MVVEARKDTATNNIKQTKTVELHVHVEFDRCCLKTCTRYHSTIFDKLAVGPCNPRILRVIGWAQIAPALRALRGHAPTDRNRRYNKVQHVNLLSLIVSRARSGWRDSRELRQFHMTMVTVSQCGWLVAVVRLCLSVCLSVTNRSSTETDKHRNLRIDRITRTTPHVAYGEFPDVACFLIKLERTITETPAALLHALDIL